MSENVSSADNQQGSEHINRYVLCPSETTRRAPPKFCVAKLRRVMI